MPLLSNLSTFIAFEQEDSEIRQYSLQQPMISLYYMLLTYYIFCPSPLVLFVHLLQFSHLSHDFVAVTVLPMNPMQ